jgi:hypothetical protein
MKPLRVNAPFFLAMPVLVYEPAGRLSLSTAMELANEYVN